MATIDKVHCCPSGLAFKGGFRTVCRTIGITHHVLCILSFLHCSSAILQFYYSRIIICLPETGFCPLHCRSTKAGKHIFLNTTTTMKIGKIGVINKLIHGAFSPPVVLEIIMTLYGILNTNKIAVECDADEKSDTTENDD